MNKGSFFIQHFEYLHENDFVLGHFCHLWQEYIMIVYGIINIRQYCHHWLRLCLIISYYLIQKPHVASS